MLFAVPNAFGVATDVIAAPAVETIEAFAAVESVVAATAAESIGASVRQGGVITTSEDEDVTAGSTEQYVDLVGGGRSVVSLTEAAAART